MWLFGSGLAALVAIALIAGGVLLTRSVKKFGDEALVRGLLTANPSGRRVLKGVLLVIAVALSFIALAQPQYGRGTRLIPATNLDVVIVLDYSKSMYAKDIAPSRILRAKSEVGRLIQDLPGARFGAVAFAGEPMQFPLTSDGAAIAQFFRQLNPNDMPVGGTAIARALEAGKELLERDPKSKDHRRVMLLVTDGEDLEGDPVAVAESAKQADITIDVVQIGGRTPEPIPDVNEAGESHGYRMDEQGKPLTTALSAEGEEQLSKIASVTGGVIVQSSHGETGITEVSRRLGRLVTEELSEKVEIVYADVYMYPLGLALLLVLAETFVNEAKRRTRPSAVPPPARKRRVKKRLKKAAAAATAGLCLSLVFVAACGKSTDKLFERHAPSVDQAISAYDAGDAGSAVSLLEGYLATGKCENGEIGTPDPVRDRPNASFDLGLGLFKLAERFGRRFGDEEPVGDGGTTPQQDAEMGQRNQGVECAQRILKAIAGDATTPVEFRARAHYLAGNLEFLRRDYKAAVKEYELSLRLIPGLPADAGDTIGSDAAYNRAIALRRIEDKENKDKDASPPDGGQPDSGEPDGGEQPDAGKNQEKDGGNDKKNDDKDRDKQKDAGPDGSAPKPQDQQPDAGQDQKKPKPQPQPSSTANQDDRMLDMLEHAPTMQEQDAKNRAVQGRVRSGMEDK
jgi:Ca-activated chloride channel family protein